jgi:hypothetical protein
MDDSAALSFDPVPRRARRDGWTPERQRLFLHELAQTRSIGRSAESVGMSRESAYRLRARPGAASFAAAWDLALAPPLPKETEEPAFRRGKVVQIRIGRRIVGKRVEYDDRILANLLRAMIRRDGLVLTR